MLARTWALANSHRFDLDGYHLCSDTQCQVYGDPRLAGTAVRQAIGATSGQVLQWQGKPISAVYHASNGGVMASAPEAWAMAPAAYLKAQPDGDQTWREQRALPLDAAAVTRLLQGGAGAYGAGHPLFRWQRTYSAAQLQTALADPGLGAIRDLKVMERGPSGRALRLRISGDGPDSPVTLRLDAIRRRLRRLPSTLFVIQPAGPGLWQFQGGGFGHGAGLSQAGAIDLARRGWSLKRILSHYYPGATLAPGVSCRQGPLESPHSRTVDGSSRSDGRSPTRQVSAVFCGLWSGWCCSSLARPTPQPGPGLHLGVAPGRLWLAHCVAQPRSALCLWIRALA